MSFPLTGIFEHLIAFIGNNPSLAGLIVFLVAMGEALFIIGLFVPSTVVLVGAGTLVGLGKLQPVPIFVWTVLGAITGDALSYWAGHIYKDRLKNIWPLSRYRALMDKGEEFFRHHGGKSVFIGRFVPGVKAVVPGIAGIVGMSATRFTVINVVSAVVWSAMHLVPGFLAGSALGAIGAVSGRLAVVLGGLLVILFLAILLGRWVILIIMPLFPGTHVALVNWFRKRPGRISQWIAHTFDPDHPRSVGMLASSLLLLITIPAFFFIVGEIAPGEPLVLSDAAIHNLFDGLRTPLGDRIMVFITLLGDGQIITITTCVVVGYLFLRKAWRRGIAVLIAMASTSVFVPLFKVAMERFRPINIYAGADAYSFPSGHATLNAVLFGLIAVLVAHDRSRWTKAGVFSLTVAYVLLIGFSRVYLGAHWASDVLAGLLFGLAMVSAFAFLFGSIHDEKVGRGVLAVLTVVVLACAGTWHISRDFSSALVKYRPRVEMTVLTYNNWLTDGWAKVPLQRISLNGKIKEPLTIQYAGNPANLAARFEAEGWHQPPHWSFLSAVGFIMGKTPPDKLPTFPRTQNGWAPDLVLIKDTPPDAKGDGSRWVLRLWPTTYVLSRNGELVPLYVGGLVHERILHPLGEFSGPKTTDIAPSLNENPAANLPGAVVRKGKHGHPIVLIPQLQ